MSQTPLLARLKASLEASAGDVVFGMEDGTVSIFGLVFGVAATTNDQSAVLIAGASGAVAAAVSMMAGTYLDAETSEDQAKVLDARIAAELKSDSGAVVGRITQRLQAAGLARRAGGDCEQFPFVAARNPEIVRHGIGQSGGRIEGQRAGAVTMDAGRRFSRSRNSDPAVCLSSRSRRPHRFGGDHGICCWSRLG